MNIEQMSESQYGTYFDVRRSVRYHDLRQGFFERMHRTTNFLTVLMAGSVLFELASPAPMASWLGGVSVASAVLAATDMVLNYSAKAQQHQSLKQRFIALEQAIVQGDASDATWQAHQAQRLSIEHDEPPVYRALDALCYLQLCRADGAELPAYVKRLSLWQKLTCQVLHWPQIAVL